MLWFSGAFATLGLIKADVLPTPSPDPLVGALVVLAAVVMVGIAWTTK